MNYVFISPAYPVTCTQFCDRLHKHGVNVLGIGDVPYDALNDQLKNALTEYYVVDTLEDYDQVYRAVAFFIHKYGRIDWLESLNEYWLPVDARLRSDFNIAVGTREEKIGDLVRKSCMKRLFIEAGIPTARQHIVSDLDAGLAFVKEVGYPVIVKPDIGVGANGTKKINGEEELRAFYSELPTELYVMEEFLCGDICTYDAILDADCEPLFESMCTYPPVIDSVQNDESIHFFTVAEVPAELRDYGRKAARAFCADRRFVHFEFINITKDYAGIGKAGGYAIMEVNMRPAGGHDPDMMNYAQSIDVFDIYAQMVTTDSAIIPETAEHYVCAYAARKDGCSYVHTPEEIMERYGSAIVMQEEMPPIDWPSMGRYGPLRLHGEVQRDWGDGRVFQICPCELMIAVKESKLEFNFITLRDCPSLRDRAAEWFHEKWGVPADAYLKCMTAYLKRETEYGWYLCLSGEQIVGGLGIIENDFHDRKDLTPNVCAVYTEEACRCQGVAGQLLNMVVEDLRAKGISPLYLVTDHIGFYERYGWEFLCMVQGDGEPEMTRMYIHR